MSFSKIQNSDFNGKGALSLPDQPTDAPQELKRKFDEDAREVVTPKFNNLIDELEASSSAANLGAVAPSPRTGTTVQGVMNSISGDLATLEGSVAQVIADDHTHPNKALLDTYTQTEADLADAVSKKHAHSNKALLDTYTQTETDLADAVAKKHSHSNKALLDTYTQTDADIADAVSKKHAHSNKALLDTYTQTEANLSDAVTKKHTHANKTYIDKIGEDGSGNPTYDGNPIGGGGSGDTFKNIVSAGTTFTASGADTFKINAGSNVTITALSSPDKGIMIAAAGGGSSTGDMLMSDYDSSGTVKTAGGIDAYVGSEIGKLDVSDSAVSGQYVSAVSETDGKISVSRASLPTVPTKVSDLTNDSGYQTASDVATAISGKEDKSALKDLAYIDKDGVSSTKYLRGDGTWQTFPSGGHTMLPTPDPSVNEAAVVSAINTAITVDGGANDDVPSLFGVGKWSNTMTKTYTVTGSTHISESGIGTWPADPDNPTSAEKATWITIPMLIGAGSNNNLDIKLTFDPTTVSVPITLGGYVIDDSDGTMCVKFGNEIPSADTATAKVGIEVIIRRTETTAVS